MVQGSDQERTEKATPQKREKARQKGQTAHTRELSTLLILLSATAVFFGAGSWIMGRLFGVVESSFRSLSAVSLEEGGLATLMTRAAVDIFTILAPILLPLMIAGIAANVLQKGFMFNMELLSLNLSRLNPLSGIKRLVSAASWGELIKGVFKLSIIGYVAYLTVRSQMDTVPGLINAAPADILFFIAAVSARVILFTCLALLFLTFMDYLFQRWQYERELRMTKQEVKDEMRQREGDPLVKARIRRIQAEIARKRMMQAVAKADVVVTNPTRLAVALHYTPDKMAAPVVVAKGAGFIALKIRETASSHGVPIVENKPLAQALFASVDIGQAIPITLYKAVAEVLAYVYRLKGRYFGRH